MVAEQIFEQQRARLVAMAHRILGSRAEAEDAVQDAWLRLSRTPPGEIGNPAGWLTTVVARVCLNMLRSRRSEPLDVELIEERDPAQEAVLADEVGLAMLVVLQTLTPAERLAFVLHDLFAVPFEDVAGISWWSGPGSRPSTSRRTRSA